MILGRVIGTVWATRKEERLEGLKFLIVQHLDLEGNPLPSFDIAVDAVEAGVGERVLIAKGSSARQSDITEKRPVDAIVMAIVEGLEFYPVDELIKEYQKREEKIYGKRA